MEKNLIRMSAHVVGLFILANTISFIIWPEAHIWRMITILIIMALMIVLGNMYKEIIGKYTILIASLLMKYFMVNIALIAISYFSLHMISSQDAMSQSILSLIWGGLMLVIKYALSYKESSHPPS